MSRTKRQRSVHDDGETEILEVEEASASLQQRSRKKARPSSPSVVESEEGSGHVFSDEDDDFIEQATQFVETQKKSQSASNTPAENGVIESVTCINFMCHKHLDVKLGPLINFITGHNGSGKSAILAALTICLGAKAAATNRGGSLKNFIMNGEESAMLAIKLKNTSDSGYQQDVFGDSITVERHFSRSGSSGFKLKSANGRIISTRKGDLDDILDYFALQIDNPMNVLTQDMARQFLNNSSPHEKYKFFMKGTQLEHLDGDYMIVEQNLDVMDADLYKKRQDVEIYLEAAQKAEHLHRISQKNDELRTKIRVYNRMMAWAQVEEQEAKVREHEDLIAQTIEKIKDLESQYQSFSEGYEQSDNAKAVANRNVDEAKNAVVPFLDEKEGINARHGGFKSEASDLQTEQRQIANELNGARKKVNNLQTEIEAEHQRLADADGGKHAETRRAIEEKKIEQQDAEDRLRAHESELPNLKHQKEIANSEFEASGRPVQRKKEEVQAAESRLNTLIRDRGKQQNAYSPAMPRLLKAIHEDHGFLEKPVGPIGNHVRLLKPSWSSILEKSFGGTLDAFIVTSKADHARLAGHMQRANCKSTILIGNHHPIDTTGHEPDEAFDTTLRVLEIDNDLVRKQLIIGQGIDQTILILEHSKARDIMNGEDRVRNVKQCFSHNIKPGEGTRFAHGAGGLSQNFMPPFQGTPRMKTDIEFQIRDQEALTRSLKVELNDLEQQSREKRDRETRCGHAIVRNERETKTLRMDFQRAQNAVEALQDKMEADAVEEGKLESLQEQLKEAQEAVSTHENSYQDLVLAKDKLKANTKEVENELAKINKSIAEAEEIVHRAERKAAREEDRRDAALREKNKAHEAVIHEKQKQSQQEERRQTEATLAEEWAQEASKISPRVPVDDGETGISLERKLVKLDEDLRTAEKRIGGNPEEIANNAKQKNMALRKAREEVEQSENLVQLLKRTLIHRRERWRRFQKYIMSRARLLFFYQLSERGFRGRLLANHKEKKLDLQVEPDQAQANSGGRSTHGLSGGEKSFSTICLLLALWEAMGAPVRCLDEFDVFMDSVNRDISMEMLIRFARECTGKQFILITPQAMGKINPEQRDIHVVKMADPVRGSQTRLVDFGIVGAGAAA